MLGIVALLEEMVNTTNWELKPRFRHTMIIALRKLLGRVAFLEKIVATTDWELEPMFRFVIDFLNKCKLLVCAVSFSHLNTYLIAMKLVLKKKRKAK
jgi:hypothetical protein